MIAHDPESWGHTHSAPPESKRWLMPWEGGTSRGLRGRSGPTTTDQADLQSHPFPEKSAAEKLARGSIQRIQDPLSPGCLPGMKHETPQLVPTCFLEVPDPHVECF